MWITVKSMMNSADTLRIDGISKLTKIEDLRERLVEHFNAPIEKQMLIYRGKQLINGHTLFDYDIGLNDTVQILVRNAPPPSPQKTEEKKEDGTEPKEEAMEEEGALEDELEVEVLEKATYKLGDIIDAKDDDGAWYEADILKITKNAKSPVWSNGKDSNANENDVKSKESASSSLKPLPEGYVEDDGFLYHIKYEGFEEDDPVKLAAKNVRPRARNKLKLEKINVGDRVMVNYNYDEPTSRGYWYDAIVTAKRCTRTIKEVEATVFFGKDLVPLEKCKIAFWWDIFAVEEPGTQINKITDANAALQTPQKREQKPNCDNCKDNPKKKCKECACRKCGGKDELEKQLMCDECDGAYHIWCLNPPLEAIPDVDEWFCPECKNDSSEIVQKGEKLKANKKKAKMASANSTSTRDWGKGMACAGKTKDCSIVPPNHLGPVPGVEVGSMWKFRLGVSEAGIHRPHVAGIHGREDDGAFSLVLSGGYEDDEDDGEEFSYTGSGGRDLSGNKRTAEQSCDQTLTRMNRALAKNCNAPIDKVNGAEAKDWKKGKPVRVVRNCKGRKHSKYAPEEGNRYDGIYKVVKYWPSKGKSGFIVWRYLLRRDDPVPAPWTKAGKKRIAELGLEMQYPEGYIEKEKEKEEKKKKAKDDENTGKSPKGRGRGKKRQRIDSSDEENQSEGESPNPSPVKKMKKAEYQLNEVVAKLIDKDKNNRKIWDEALGFRSEGAKGFLAKVEELFSCVCCQDIVFQPITTSCSHNVCKSCLQRSFKAEVYSCPACRHELGKDYSLAMNKSLKEALNLLFPGYEAGR